jgi:hypothetical protein
MAFLNTFFLYFLPLAAIPLIISLIFNMNRKKEQFPSLDFILNILKRELSDKRIRMRIRQVLRMLVFLCAILAFASPVLSHGGGDNGWTVIADNSASMSRFDIGKVIAGLKGQYRIEKIYYGGQPMTQESLSEGGYSYGAETDFGAAVAGVLAGNPARNIILVSDAQKSSIPKEFRLPAGVENVKFVLLSDTNRNLYIAEASVYPMVGLPGVKSVITVKIGGEIHPGDRVKILVSGKEIASEEAKPMIQLTRFIEGNGAQFGEAALEGDGFAPDNHYYFPLISAGVPAVYTDIKSPALMRVLSALFPKYYLTQSFQSSDVIIAGTLPKPVTDKPVLLFCENSDTFGRVMERDLKIFCQFSKKDVTGDIQSEYGVLNMIKAFRVETAFENIAAPVIAKAADMPLAYRVKNYYLFNFSISANEDSLSSSVFLLLLCNEIFMEYYSGRYILDGESAAKAGVFYDLQGNIVTPVKPGVYREKETGKFAVKNLGTESLFEFYTPDEIKAKISVPAEILEYEPRTDALKSFRWEFTLPLMALALLLIVVETVWVKG